MRNGGGLLRVVPAEKGRHLRRPKFRECRAGRRSQAKVIRSLAVCHLSHKRHEKRLEARPQHCHLSLTEPCRFCRCIEITRITRDQDEFRTLGFGSSDGRFDDPATGQTPRAMTTSLILPFTSPFLNLLYFTTTYEEGSHRCAQKVTAEEDCES